MEKINTFRKNITYDNLFIYSTFLLAVFPLLTYPVRTVTVIIWVFFGLISVYQTRKNLNYKQNYGRLNLLIASVIPYLLLCISLLYTENLEDGYNRLRQLLPIIIFPCIFFLNQTKISKTMIKNLCWVFSLSVLIFVVYLIIKSITSLDFLLADLSYEELKSNNLHKTHNLDQNIINKLKTRRFRNFILDQSNSHFTYQGIWIIFALFFLFKECITLFRQRKTIYLLLVLPIIILTTWLFFISSRMPILIMIAASCFTLLVFNKVSVKRIFSFSLLTITALVLSYLVFTPFKARVNELLNYKLELPSSGNDIENYTSTNVRNGVYYCSILTAKENLLFGVGVGDSQDKLNECYTSNIGAKIYTWTDYNTHNQYLFFLLSAGFLAFLFFIFLLIIYLRYALVLQNDLLLYFVSIICLICLTENILSRSDGITFFAFFSGLFLFNLKKTS